MNFGQLKSNRAIRWILWPLIIMRRRLLKKDRALEIYYQVVRGGEIVLSPQNIPGEFRISALSHLAYRIMRDGQYESEVTEEIKKIVSKRGGDCINIGANVGLMSIFIAKLPGCQRILAIEPNAEAYRLLEHNIKANGVEGQVITEYVCLGAEKGMVSLSSIPGKSEYSSIDGIVHRSVVGQMQVGQMVPCETLDAVVEKHGLRPTFVLIDTEGAEYLVFSGASRTLVDHQPTIILEISSAMLGKFGKNSGDLLDMFEANGYEVLDIVTGKVVRDRRFEGEALAVPRKCI